MSSNPMQLLFGHSEVAIDLEGFALLGTLLPRRHMDQADESALIRQALSEPVDSPRLSELVRQGMRVVIVISDLTRPCPSALLLPPVVEELNASGIPDSDISIVLALGLHRPMSAREQETAVGTEIYGRLQVLNHDPADTIWLGTTSAGTPVEIFRPVVEADLRVCLANIELHYMAGFSGGAKSILPGCASKATIQANHSLMVRPDARSGKLAGNPLRADIEEGVALVGADFVLNVVVDEAHRIVGAFAGDATQAHRLGCALVAARGQAEIAALADIVLVSAGGYPKDINLYQAQKALDNAAHAVRPNGLLILVAECAEGFGNPIFEQWMRTAKSPDDLLARLQRSFVLGGHKAAAIAAVQKRATIALVSCMPAEVVTSCGLEPFSTVQSALLQAAHRLGPNASLLVMPQGGSVLPHLVDSGTDRF